MIQYILLLLPVISALVIVLSSQRAAKWIALIGSTASLIAAAIFAVQFPHWTTGGFWPDLSTAPILGNFGVDLQIGVDSVSLLLVLLTVFLTPLAIAGSFSAINRARASLVHRKECARTRKATPHHSSCL